MTELVGHTVSSAAELHEISPHQGGGLNWKATGGRREHFLPMDLFSSFDPGVEKGKVRSAQLPGLVAGLMPHLSCNGVWLQNGGGSSRDLL